MYAVSQVEKPVLNYQFIASYCEYILFLVVFLVDKSRILIY